MFFPPPSLHKPGITLLSTIVFSTTVLTVPQATIANVDLNQPPTPIVERTVFKDWDRLCIPKNSQAKQCIIAQQLFFTPQKSNTSHPIRLLSFEVSRMPQTATPAYYATITLPSEIYKGAGILLKVDRKETREFSLNYCTPHYCVIQGYFPRNLLREFIQGRQATITLLHSSQQQELILPLSLLGFTAAINSL